MLFKKTMLVAGSMLASASAMAVESTGVDITEALATLGGVEANLVSIGGIMIGLAAVAVGIKWVKGMIFG